LTLKRKVIFISILIMLVLFPFIIVTIKSKNTSQGIKKNSVTVLEGYLSEGETLNNILIEHNIRQEEVYSIIRELKKVFNVRRCNIGDRWEIYRDQQDNFLKFIYYNGSMDFYVVATDRQNKAYISSAEKIESQKTMRGIKGRITRSLYESMSFAGVNPELIIQFAEIFASQIDFFTECRKDDIFSVVWGSYIDKKGNVLKDERIAAASYTSGDETLYAFYFETPDGKIGYYDEQGQNVEDVFLKAPLNYRRISSYFTHKRFHPILKIYRQHLGIDYAAPTGTPVSSIGDGIITAAGRRTDGLGITVVVKHPNSYNSWYGHLSGIAKGVSKGSHVSKGQVIGYVGSTGTATGPHLDFRLQKNGKFINFLTLKMPPAERIPEKYMDEFKIAKNMLMDINNRLKQDKIIVVQNTGTRKI